MNIFHRWEHEYKLMTVRRLKLWIFECKRKRQRERENQKVSSRGVNTDLKWSPRIRVLNMSWLLKMMPGHWKPLLTREPEIINLASVTALDSGFLSIIQVGSGTQTKLLSNWATVPLGLETGSGVSLTWAKERGCPLKGVPPENAETLSRWEHSVGLSKQAWEDASSHPSSSIPWGRWFTTEECLPLKLFLGC